MANPDRINNDMHVNGHFSAKTMAIPSNTVVNDDVHGSADISYTKLQAFHKGFVAQNIADAVVNEEVPIHTAYGATGTVIAVRVGCAVKAVGVATCDVDVKKNGTTILTGAVQLTSGNTNWLPVAGTISVDAYVQDDTFSVSFDGTAGGGTLAKGVFCEVLFAEDAV